MGQYVNNGKVSIPSSHNFGDEPNILSELGGLLRVGKQSDGRYHQADMCQADSINKWAKYKPVEVNKAVNINDADRYNANQGFNVSFYTGGTSNIPVQLIDAINTAGTSWGYIKVSSYNRIRDFHGYDHNDTTTPFESAGMPYDGVARVENDTISTTHMFFNVWWHQRASQIQPKDMAIFNDYKDSHYFKMGIIVKDPSKSYAELHFIYDNISAANSDNYLDAIDMPMSVSSEEHYKAKVFRVPYSTSASSYIWKALLVCVRVNKATGDIAWLYLPTEKPITFTVDTATGDVEMFWAMRDNIKPLRVVTAGTAPSGFVGNVQNIYMTNIFAGLQRFFDSSNLDFRVNFELYYNGSAAGNAAITESTAPIYVSGSGSSTEYTYRTAVRGETGTYFPVDSWSNLVLYVSVALDNGDAPDSSVYLKLDEISMQGNYMKIPIASSHRAGYTLQSIMDALGSSNYEIVDINNI